MATTPTRKKGALLSEALTDIAVRFLVGLPDEELSDNNRLCFHIEEAFYHYGDYYYSKHPNSYPNLDFPQFFERITKLVPETAALAPKAKEIVKKYHKYKNEIPTFGAVVLTADGEQVLLVQHFISPVLGFPKGKVNRGETEADCAIREVMEETGCDISELIDDRYTVVFNNGRKQETVFIVIGVPEDYPFKPTPTAVREIKFARLYPRTSLPPYAYHEQVSNLVSYVLGEVDGWLQTTEGQEALSYGADRPPMRFPSLPSPTYGEGSRFSPSVSLGSYPTYENPFMPDYSHSSEPFSASPFNDPAIRLGTPNRASSSEFGEFQNGGLRGATFDFNSFISLPTWSSTNNGPQSSQPVSVPDTSFLSVEVSPYSSRPGSYSSDPLGFGNQGLSKNEEETISFGDNSPFDSLRATSRSITPIGSRRTPTQERSAAENEVVTWVLSHPPFPSLFRFQSDEVLRPLDNALQIVAHS